MSTTPIAFQRCISPNCGATYDIREVRVACERCGDLLDVAYDWDRAEPPADVGGLRVAVGAAARTGLSTAACGVSIGSCRSVPRIRS